MKEETKNVACHLCQERCDCDRCKIQRAAPRMLAFLERLCEGRNDFDLPDFLVRDARAILRDVDGAR